LAAQNLAAYQVRNLILHILFLTDNFPPETNAPATRTFEHTRRWVAAGHRVTVLANAPNFPTGKIFPGYRNSLWQEEVMSGIRVVRVWTYITANEGFVKRSLDYLSFAISAVIAGLFLPRPDVIIATSPQIFTALGGCILAWSKRRPFVFELRDLWPDSIVAVKAMKEGMLIRLLRRLEYFLYRRAAKIISVTHSFKHVLTKKGIGAERIAVVRNGVDLGGFMPGPKPQELVQKLGVEGKFVAMYVGTIGMAHGLGSLLAAAEQLQHRTDIVFILVGTGAEKKQLEEEARRLKLQNVLFVGSVSRDEVKKFWLLCDAALVLLRDTPLFRHVIPSKIFEAMGSGRPIILGVRGESEEIVSKAGAGVLVEPEDGHALAQSIIRLADNTEECHRMGHAGRRFVEREFDRDRLAMDMLHTIQSVVVADQKKK
jgi:colanic acid biosynthesis glycosyl transferase WcaI